MAVARIFSCSPEQAAALVQDLERQGYKVEVLRPEDSPAGPADLEIQYELCDKDRIVERAKELAKEFDTDIAVASGALGVVRFEAAPEYAAQGASAMMAQEPQRSGEPPTVIDVPVTEVWIDSGASARDIGTQDARLQEAVKPVQENSAVATALPSQPNAGSSAPPNVISSAWSRGVAALVAAAGSSLETTRALWLAGMHKMREQRERAAIRAAEVRAQREQQLLELTCRRAEALQRTRQIEAARRAAAGYVSQLQRESGASPGPEPAISGDAQSAANAKPGSVWWMPSQHMKSIAAGAAAAGALFALTLGISTLRSKPATTKVTAPAPVVTVQSNSVIAHSVPARIGPVLHKNTAKTVSSPSRPRTGVQENDSVPDDVVVRHFAPPQKLQSRVSGSVKRYSDLDE